jgi:hypothetical protein
MVRMDTIEKERFRSQCPELWNQEDCRYQTIEVKHNLSSAQTLRLIALVQAMEAKS